jgi:hypothetical protein
VQNTIVDVVRKGNLELLHSSIIAWLLDPSADHGLGSRFLDAFAARARCPVDSSTATVRTEVTGRRSRYDIEIVSDEGRVIIENKMKSVGNSPQLDRYTEDACHLVALGMSDLTFEERDGEGAGAVVLDYAALLECIGEATDGRLKPDVNDFHVLIRHYRAYLTRELGLLEDVDRCYRDGDEERHALIADQLSSGRYSLGDIRFVHRHLLERFRRCCLADSSEWTIDKNQQSGVWLASHNVRQLGMMHPLRSDIAQIVHEEGHLWLHVELHAGITAPELSDVAGTIHLRAATPQENRDLFHALKRVLTLRPGESWYRQPSSKAGSFGVLRRSLHKADLFFDRLEAQIAAFGRGFAAQ